MKNFTQRGMALLLSVLLLCSLSVGALAADDVALNATLNVEKLTKSEEAQTVTLTVAPASALNIAGYGFTVNLPRAGALQPLPTMILMLRSTQETTTLKPIRLDLRLPTRRTQQSANLLKLPFPSPRTRQQETMTFLLMALQQMQITARFPF